MQHGYTTGSAATAATVAALCMIIEQREIEVVNITTPAGIIYTPNVYVDSLSEKRCKAFVYKESGDDPDITNGIRIYADVTLIDDDEIRIVGGVGVGKVTRPGLNQPVGEFAINSTPRRMITENVREILSESGISKGVLIEISVPEGVELAEKTFNPHMGIVGGISIIGTSGIVEPMSTKALVDTIALDIKMQYEEGKETCVICPGNYGSTFLINNYGMDEKEIVHCSNYVGDSIKMAVETGFRKILFCSHIGKLIKVSGGMMNTHSMYGDRRMELMVEATKEALENRNIFNEWISSADNNTGEIISNIAIEESNKWFRLKSKIMDCVSTTAALDVLDEENLVSDVSSVILEKSVRELEKAADYKAEIKCILYENKYGELKRNF